MPQVQLLDEQTAQRLNRVLDEFYNEVETGAPPTEALRKLATVHNLTPDYIRLVGRAYNSGMTNYFIHGVKNADGVYRFPLCDPEQVVRELFGKPVRKKKANVSTDYVSEPHELGLTEPPPATFDLFPKAADYRSCQSIEEEVRSIYQNILKKRAEYEMVMHGWSVGLDSALGALSQYFNRIPCIDPVEVRLNAEAAGLPAAVLLKHAGVDETPHSRYVTGQPVDWRSEPYALIKRAAECLQKFQFAKQHYTQLDEECRKIESRFGFKTSMPQAGTPLLDGPIAKALLTTVMKTAADRERRSQSRRGSKKSDRSSDDRGKPTSIFSLLKFKDLAAATIDKTYATGTLLARPLKQLPARLSQSKSLQQEEFVKSLEEDNARQVLILLTDFTMNDPIISQFDPDDVLRTFKEITAVAPHVAAQPDILRSTLRKALAAGGLDPLDIRMLIDIDKRLGMRAKALSRYYNYRDERDES